MALIELSSITKTYHIGEMDVDVLKGVDLSVEAGELLAIMGESGGGKSTLMNIIGFLDSPSGGAYKFDGEDVDHLDDNDLARIRNQKIGFIFQQFNLLPRLTALENVSLPLVYRGVPSHQREKLAEQMLKRVGMGDRMTHHPPELSGGQQQRVAIARALSGSPSLILADEPTGALDSQVSQEIMDIFLDLNREKKITTVMVTHDPKVGRQCRRTVRMADGCLVEV
ncbi:MAG: ABC transporter ATP-binding protein [Desulfarculaceae bacterium]|nr:ABC transporter ATP-binding protein [Desulfarculaceae bacterium]MCF8047026.1 ABC transporter ATP-binding protein [Desulfarculaceae bacterium]MCF8065209.1 ABC transporter ATP-binding protein [Desulfarculaceae bacterium]MCF8096502.1 ABC transporter ATP-binding protein [Desulfarculaceae bacterium]MCF8121756.1 ABC transporter ATP-binding protein [Desulfarculaceae bacterium]